jgi:hypothetical protein
LISFKGFREWIEPGVLKASPQEGTRPPTLKVAFAAGSNLSRLLVVAADIGGTVTTGGDGRSNVTPPT